MKQLTVTFALAMLTGCATHSPMATGTLAKLDEEIAMRIERIRVLDQNRLDLPARACTLADVPVDRANLALPAAELEIHRPKTLGIAGNRRALLEDLGTLALENAVLSLV